MDSSSRLRGAAEAHAAGEGGHKSSGGSASISRRFNNVQHFKAF
jgi:hypothetical protein